MKTLQDIKKDFLREASEYDTGKNKEDFHAYLRQHNLEHHLSETQKQDRQMESNGLNAMGMVAGIAIPLTLGAIFGYQRLTNNNIMGHGDHSNFNYDEARQVLGYNEPRYNARIIEDSNSLSGHNTREMPMADTHIGQPVNMNELRNMVRTPLENVGSGLYQRGNKGMIVNVRTGEAIIPLESELTPPQSLL
jgi:hypothetical protein